jgi:ComEC/Rec2-related protein
MRWHFPPPTAWPFIGAFCLLAGGVGAARGSSLFFVMAMTGVGAMLALRGLRRLSLILVPLLVAVGWLAGQISVGREQAMLTADLPSVFETMTVVALTDSEASPFGRRWFIGRPLQLAIDTQESTWRGPNLMVRIDREVTWSEVLRIGGRLQKGPGNAGGHFYAGIVDVTAAELLDRRSSPLIETGNFLRARVLQKLDGGRPAEALLAGFLVGDTTDLPESDQVAMRRAGISHFVAVSGANVAGFLVLWWLLLGPIGVGTRWRGWVGLVGLAVFLIATRWEPSVVRAGLMAAIIFIGRALGLAIHAWPALGAGASLSVLAAPALVSDLGFQLSLAATAGIMVGYDLLPLGLPSLLRKPLGVTIAAQAAVTPLLLARGNGIPLLSPLTNLISAPLVAASTLFGAFAVIGGPGPLLWVAVSAADVVLAIARWAAWHAQLGAEAFALIVPAMLLTIGLPSIRPVVAAIACAALVVTLVSRGVSGPAVVFIDVGQGDAALLVSADGEAVLIDGGPDSRLLWEAMYEYGVNRLRLVVATHPHDDHIVGLVGLAGRVPIGEVWESGESHPNPTWDVVEAQLMAASVPVITPIPGTRLEMGGVSLEVLGPQRRYDGANDQSIVILAQTARTSLLMTGDIEVAAQRDLGAIDIDILKVPHHGGNTSLPEWLVETSPAIAVISVGTNSFGHPAPEVVEVLEGTGARVITTWAEGDVFLPLDRPVAGRDRALARVRGSGQSRRPDTWRLPGGLRLTRPKPRPGAFLSSRWRCAPPQGQSRAVRVRSGGGLPAVRERRDPSCEWRARVAVPGPAAQSSAFAPGYLPIRVRKYLPRPQRRLSGIDQPWLFRCRSSPPSSARSRLPFRRRCHRAARTCRVRL